MFTAYKIEDSLNVKQNDIINLLHPILFTYAITEGRKEQVGSNCRNKYV